MRNMHDLITMHVYPVYTLSHLFIHHAHAHTHTHTHTYTYTHTHAHTHTHTHTHIHRDREVGIHFHNTVSLHCLCKRVRATNSTTAAAHTNPPST